MDGFRRPGVLLEQTNLLSGDNIESLHNLSVRTVEELLGLIYADIDGVTEFLHGVDLTQLQADAYQSATMAIMSAEQEQQHISHPLGALLPDEVEVEQVADPRTFASYAGAAQQESVRHDGTEVIHACLLPARDQGKRGTCVAYAATAVLECLHLTQRGTRLEFSPQFLYWNAKQADGHPNTDGTWLRIAVPTTMQFGDCTETSWAYNPRKIPGNIAQGPPPPTAVAEADLYRTASCVELDNRSVDSIRQEISNGFPVAVSVPVYESWANNPAAKALGIIPMPLPRSRLIGGHAMCIVGYQSDDDFPGGGAFIVRNSWGMGWAPLSPVQPGYGLIPFTYVDRYGLESVTIRL